MCVRTFGHAHAGTRVWRVCVHSCRRVSCSLFFFCSVSSHTHTHTHTHIHLLLLHPFLFQFLNYVGSRPPFLWTDPNIMEPLPGTLACTRPDDSFNLAWLRSSSHHALPIPGSTTKAAGSSKAGGYCGSKSDKHREHTTDEGEPKDHGNHRDTEDGEHEGKTREQIEEEPADVWAVSELMQLRASTN
jgi:hypothetical protein